MPSIDHDDDELAELGNDELTLIGGSLATVWNSVVSIILGSDGFSGGGGGGGESGGGGADRTI